MLNCAIKAVAFCYPFGAVARVSRETVSAAVAAVAHKRTAASCRPAMLGCGLVQPRSARTAKAAIIEALCRVTGFSALATSKTAANPQNGLASVKTQNHLRRPSHDWPRPYEWIKEPVIV